MAKPIPEGYNTLNPSLAVDDAKKAIDFYKKAFGAKERLIMPGPNDTIAHAELEIGDSVIMVADPMPQMTAKPPKQIGGTTINIFMYVEDVDSVFQDAIDAGADVTMPLENQFWGDRFGQVTDPFGHAWSIATHVEDVSEADMAERAKEAMAAMGS